MDDTTVQDAASDEAERSKPREDQHPHAARSSASGQHRPPVTKDALAPIASFAPPTRRRIGRRIEQIVLRRFTWACVIITESHEILSWYGPTSEYLEVPTGLVRMNLLAWAKAGLYAALKTGLEQAIVQMQPVSLPDLHVERDGESCRTECRIEPIAPLAGEERLFLVGFRDMPAPIASTTGVREDAKLSTLDQLRERLQRVQPQLDRAQRQLHQTNEEHRASLEELRAHNEELRTSNEQLAAGMDELVNANNQLGRENAALRRSKSDSANLLMNARVPILFLDTELRIRRFTPHISKVMCIVDSDVGRSVDQVKMHYQDESLMANALRVLETLVPMESEVRTDDGSWYARRILPHRNERQKIDGVCITFNELGQQKLNEQQLRAARDYAATVLAAVPTAVAVLDKELRINSANTSFCQAHGRSEDDVVGLPFFQLNDGVWDTAQVRKLLELTVPERGAVTALELVHPLGPRPDDPRRVMTLEAHQMRLAEREDFIMLAINDITEHRLASEIIRARAEELAREHRRKDEFLAMLGHELRNPLAVLVHGLQLLGAGVEDRGGDENTRDMMQRQLDRVGEMLDQLLDLARLNVGKAEIAHTAVLISDVVQAAIETVAPFIADFKHTLTVSTPSDSPFVLGDSLRLTQVVENLLGNAAKYTREHGRIDLVVESDQELVRLLVRDNGIGIDADLAAHIFEPFTQAPRTLDRSAGGLGLGLPLVARVVEAHGGTVSVFSEGRGKGAEFTVTLPRMRERRNRPAPKPHDWQLEKGAGPPLRILVVDDVVDAALLLARLLELAGHVVRVAHDGYAALEQAKAFDPHVMLLDLGLPGIDGYEVASRISATADAEPPLLVALTGYRYDEAAAKAVGFTHHLIKPVEMPLLRELLSQRQAKISRAP